MRRYGQLLAGPVKQSGAPLTYRSDGLIEGQVVYKFDYPTQKGIVLSNIGKGHPDEPLAMLYAAHIEKGKIDTGFATYDCIGLYRDPTLRVVSGKPAVSTTPIEAHSKFATEALAGTASSPKNNAYFDPDTGEFLGFFGGAKSGTRSFYDGSVIVRATYYTRTPPSLAKAFTITTALPNIPQVRGVKNWLQMPPDWDEVPNTGIFKVTDEFMGSGEKGWDTDIYANA